VLAKGPTISSLSQSLRICFLDLSLANTTINVRAATRAPVSVYERASILNTIEFFKRTPINIALLVDEYDHFQGVVTQTDPLEATAGDLPDPQGISRPKYERCEDGSFVSQGSMSVYDIPRLLELKEIPPGQYQTLAGFALSQLGQVPQVGDHFSVDGWRFEIQRSPYLYWARLTAS
jgi:putative hemolysin